MNYEIDIHLSVGGVKASDVKRAVLAGLADLAEKICLPAGEETVGGDFFQASYSEVFERGAYTWALDAKRNDEDEHALLFPGAYEEQAKEG